MSRGGGVWSRAARAAVPRGQQQALRIRSAQWSLTRGWPRPAPSAPGPEPFLTITGGGGAQHPVAEKGVCLLVSPSTDGEGGGQWLPSTLQAPRHLLGWTPTLGALCLKEGPGHSLRLLLDVDRPLLVVDLGEIRRPQGHSVS